MKILRAALACQMLLVQVAAAQSVGTWGAKNQTPGQTATSPQGAPKVGVVGGFNTADTSFVPFTFTTAGQRTVEQSDLGTQTSGWITLASGATTDTTAVGMADSSAVQTTYASYVLHGLFIRASIPGPIASPFAIRVAVSIRTHLNGIADSVSTAPVCMSRFLSITGTSLDSLKVGSSAAPTAVAAGEDEFIVTLTRDDAGAAKWSQGYARYLPIETTAGQGLRLINFSVRWRVLGPGTNTNSFSIAANATMLR